MNNLKEKSDKELREIMRDSIDNSYVPSSIYHKAKQELDFRNNQRMVNEKGEILKLSPELYGIGINIKPLWKKIIALFKKTK